VSALKTHNVLINAVFLQLGCSAHGEEKRTTVETFVLGPHSVTSTHVLNYNILCMHTLFICSLFTHFLMANRVSVSFFGVHDVLFLHMLMFCMILVGIIIGSHA
jgi:hypothetical protein